MACVATIAELAGSFEIELSGLSTLSGAADQLLASRVERESFAVPSAMAGDLGHSPDPAIAL